MKGWVAAAALALGGMAMAKSIGWKELIARTRPASPAPIVYGSDPLQQGFLWTPKGRAVGLVLMIHGGCWQTKVAKADLMDWAAADLVRRGFAVWNIEYRGVDRPGGGYPGTFADVAAAADALPGVAAKHGLDASHIVAVGHSAGGHLALWLAARAHLPRTSPLARDRPLPIAGVVSLGGLPDLASAKTEAAHACGADTVDRLVDRTGVSGAARFADTSIPPLKVSAPMVLVNGAEDTVAPPAVAARFAAETGARAVTAPGQGHFDEIAPGQPAWEAAVREIQRLAQRAGARPL